MTRSDGSVIIDTRMDTSGFREGVKSMKGQINGLMGAVGKLGAAIGVAFGVKALVDFGKSAIQSGAEAQAMASQFKQVFNTVEQEATSSLNSIAERTGIVTERLKGSYTQIAAFAKTAGMTEREAMELADRAMIAVADSAAFYDRSLEDVTESLRSFLKGNFENDAALGLSATEFTRNAAAVKLFGKNFNELNEQQKQLTLLQMVEDANKLSGAMGQAARESDTWNNVTGNLSQALKNLSASIGQYILPVAIQVVKYITSVIESMNSLLNKVFQLNYAITGQETYSDAAEDAKEYASEISGIADATKEAEKAQKKYLSGLDELRTFTDSNDSVAGSGLIGGIEAVTNPSNNNDTSSVEKTGNLLDVLKAKIQELADKFTIFNNIVETVKGTFELFRSAAEDLVGLLVRPITENKDGILEAAKNIATFTLDIVERITEGFKKFVDELNRVYDERISPVIENITDDISRFIEQFLDWFNNDISPILNKWGEKFDEIWSEHVDPLLTNLAEFFGKVAEGVGTLWDETIKPFVEWIGEKLGAFLPPLIEGFGDAFLNAFEKIIEIADSLLGALEGIIDFIVGVFTGDWELAWEGLVTVFENIVSAITSFFEGLFGFIFESIESVANGIGGLFGNGKGGGAFVPQIPSMQIPHLATGAVIPPNAPFTAVLGDQKHGTNIEAPLETIKQAVREVVGVGGGGSYAFTAQINRRTLFEEMIDEAKLRQTTSGRNPFELA